MNRTQARTLPGIGLAGGAGVGVALGHLALGAAVGLFIGALASAAAMWRGASRVRRTAV